MGTPGAAGLRKIQFGKQSSLNTPVAATTIWRGAGNTISDERKLEEIQEWIGIFDGADRTRIVQLLAMDELQSTPLTFEQVQYLLAMAFGGPTSGVADGAGDGFIYTTPIPTTTVPSSPSYYTVEAGDDFESERMEDVVCTKISIQGNLGETLKVSASLMGRQATRMASGMTGALGIPAVEEVVTQLGLVSLDDVTGDYGDTQVSTCIYGVKLDIELYWRPNFCMNGSLAWQAPLFRGKKISGELIYSHAAAVSGSGGAKDFFRNQTAKLLQVNWGGTDFASAGTAYSKKTFIVNLPIKFGKPSVIDSKDDISIVTMPFVSRYNATKGDAGNFIVVNDLTALL